MAHTDGQAGELTLYVCHINEGGPPVHPCRLAHEALRKAGHEYRTEVFDRNHPFGLFTKGRRPELKAISGQEKLPVLQLPGRLDRERLTRHRPLGARARARALRQHPGELSSAASGLPRLA